MRLSLNRVTHAFDMKTELSPTERAVGSLFLRGLRDAEIAQRLGLSTRGVRWRLNAMAERLGVVSRIRLAVVLYLLIEVNRKRR